MIYSMCHVVAPPKFTKGRRMKVLMQDLVVFMLCTSQDCWDGFAGGIAIGRCSVEVLRPLAQ